MPPYLLLSFLVGAIYGVIFHLWQGKTFQDLAIYFFSGVAGFILGHAFGSLMGFEFLRLGPLHLAEATMVCWAVLFIVQWLKI